MEYNQKLLKERAVENINSAVDLCNRIPDANVDEEGANFLVNNVLALVHISIAQSLIRIGNLLEQNAAISIKSLNTGPS